MEKLSTSDLESQLLSIEGRVEECLEQFKSHAAEVEAKAQENLRLVLALFPKTKRLALDKGHKDRVEFVEKLARRLKLVARNVRDLVQAKNEEIGVKDKDDGVYQLITRNFSDLLIEEIKCVPELEQQMEQQHDLDVEARESKLKEELDKRFQEYAKNLQLKLQKQLEDQLQNLKERDEELEKQLEQVKKKQKNLHDQYPNTYPTAPTVVARKFPGCSFPILTITDSNFPVQTPGATEVARNFADAASNKKRPASSQVQQQTSHSSAAVLYKPSPSNYISG